MNYEQRQKAVLLKGETKFTNLPRKQSAQLLKYCNNLLSKLCLPGFQLCPPDFAKLAIPLHTFHELSLLCLHEQAQMKTKVNYWGDADVDHSQIIGEDAVKLLGGYIPHPPGFWHP